MNKIFSGTVVSKKDLKTVKVELISHKSHPKYKKVIKKEKRLQVHNENFALKVGDKVIIKSSRLYSKNKAFLVIKKEEAKKRLLNQEE
ncbi:30S ribosomal protein S17 [endosymbiont GvMRE of Glomus versiforme]|uniref:30S ribosomal protein S17 n=1 Tax=endosymbiont GvMRE of Glomus versiforme TaxID=2039283 RepID=UPI000EE3594A|nr:30S ribosomal protein S17 [endosymbiont GvMRE of Glomus versiforme]RHZ37520.1 30S ribosomal protein S17 [endosymbiont GvMRE of Glomus versiforme]